MGYQISAAAQSVKKGKSFSHGVPVEASKRKKRNIEEREGFEILRPQGLKLSSVVVLSVLARQAFVLGVRIASEIFCLVRRE